MCGVEHLVVGVHRAPWASGLRAAAAAASPASSRDGSGASGGNWSNGVRDVQDLRDFLMDASRLALESAMPRAKAYRSASFKGSFNLHNHNF